MGVINAWPTGKLLPHEVNAVVSIKKLVLEEILTAVAENHHPVKVEEQGGGLVRVIALLDQYLNVQSLANCLAAISVTSLEHQAPAADAVRWLLTLGSHQPGRLAELLSEGCSATWLFPRLLFLARLCRLRGARAIPHKLAKAIRKAALGYVVDPLSATPAGIHLMGQLSDIPIVEIGKLMATAHFAGVPGELLKRICKSGWPWASQILLHRQLSVDQFGSLAISDIRHNFTGSLWQAAVEGGGICSVNPPDKKFYFVKSGKQVATTNIIVVDGDQQESLVSPYAVPQVCTLYSSEIGATARVDLPDPEQSTRTKYTRVWVDRQIPGKGVVPMIAMTVLILRPVLNI